MNQQIPTDSAILLLIAEQQATIATLRADNAGLRETLAALQSTEVPEETKK